jgi:hypothetical protein
MCSFLKNVGCVQLMQLHQSLAVISMRPEDWHHFDRTVKMLEGILWTELDSNERWPLLEAGHVQMQKPFRVQSDVCGREGAMALTWRGPS